MPALPESGPWDSVAEQWAQHAILAYAVRSLLVGRGDAIDRLRDGLRQEFGASHPGSSLFDQLDPAGVDGSDDDDEVASVVRRCLISEQPSLDLVFLAGLRLSNWMAVSLFKSVLSPALKPWLIAKWERILQAQRFLLRSPQQPYRRSWKCSGAKL